MEDISSAAGVDWLDDSTGALLVDLDNDSDKDLVVATHRALMVMENDGVGRFRLRRRLAAVYSGPVGIAQLTADLALLTAAPEAELARLSPRPGRWLVDPRLIDRAAYTSDLAAHFASHGFPNEAQRLYAMAPPQGGPGRAPDLFNQAKPT